VSLVRVPDVVRRKALAAGARQWLDDLPDLVASLERDWLIAVGATYDGGTEAYVAQATLSDGMPAVLKLVVPRPRGTHAHEEITVLRLANGAGCAQLLRSDERRGALLLERLGPALFDLGLPVRRRQEILCDAAMRLWRPAPDCGLRTGAAKGRWLAEFITRTWAELDHPCSERAIEHALACAERRIAAHDDERAVLLHGDVHQWNALRAADETAGGFKLIDPDGLLGEPEYDLGIIMREDPVELLRDGDPHQRARWLATRTGLDATAIWEWGVVERVSTGLLATTIGLQPAGRDMLATADHLAAFPGAVTALRSRSGEGRRDDRGDEEDPDRRDPQHRAQAKDHGSANQRRPHRPAPQRSNEQRCGDHEQGEEPPGRGATLGSDDEQVGGGEDDGPGRCREARIRKAHASILKERAPPQ
jgi:streptomycin 6-kinase